MKYWIVVGYFKYKKNGQDRYGVHIQRDMVETDSAKGIETKLIFPDVGFVPKLGAEVDVRFTDRGYVDSVEYVN